jgi:hypothetical protein
LVATFPPGGLADTIGRLVAPPLGAALGQSVVIDNRAGAGGTIGADLVAKSPPDGYTLVISHASPHGFAPGIYPQLPYDPVADFAHLGMLVDTPSALLVTGKSPFMALDDLLTAARRGGARYGSSGVGSSGVGCGSSGVGCGSPVGGSGSWANADAAIAREKGSERASTVSARTAATEYERCMPGHFGLTRAAPPRCTRSCDSGRDG